MNHATAFPFDALAAAYDREFTDSHIGRMMRRAVWDRIDCRFSPGQRILELNCGTGADAIHLAQRGVSVLATDASPEMVSIAAAKAAQSGSGDLIHVRRLAWEQIVTLGDVSFDGVLSNFGGINCVDFTAVIPSLMQRLRPGAAGFICAMGPYCVWEWLWYLAHGSPRKAFRRLTPGGLQWRGIHVRYPSIRELSRALSPWCRVTGVTALGVLLPPPFAEGLASRSPRLTDLLNRCERRLGRLPPLPSLADHYLLEFERL